MAQLFFDSKEQAVDFAVRQGFTPLVEDQVARRKISKSYALNFHWSRHTRVSTK